MDLNNSTGIQTQKETEMVGHTTEAKEYINRDSKGEGAVGRQKRLGIRRLLPSTLAPQSMEKRLSLNSKNCGNEALVILTSWKDQKGLSLQLLSI